MAMKYVGSLDGTPPAEVTWCVNDSQTITAGSIVVVSSGKITLAADAASAGTVAGVALDAITTGTATASDTIRVDVNPRSIYEMGYTGSSKTSLAATDVGTKFDLGASTADAIDLDDTTGGFCIYVGGADSSALTCNCVIAGNFFNV